MTQQQQQHPQRDPKTIGASDVAKICEESNYKEGIFNVWMRLTGRIDWDNSDAGHLWWGKMVENPILDHFEKKYNIKLVRQPGYVHRKYEWAAATPDGMCTNNRYMVDAKNISWQNPSFSDWLHSSYPDEYKIQVHWQAFCANSVLQQHLKNGYLHVQLAGEEPNDRLVPINYDFMRDLFKVVSDFREAYVLTDTPPPNDASKEYAQFLAKYFDSPVKDDYIEADAAAEALMRQLYDHDRFRKQTETAYQYTQNELMNKVGDKYGIISEQFGKFIWYEVGGRVSDSKIVEILRKKLRMSDATIEKLRNEHRGESYRVARFYPSKKLKMEALNEQ